MEWLSSTGYIFESVVVEIHRGESVELKDKEKHVCRNLLKSYKIIKNKDKDENK